MDQENIKFLIRKSKFLIAHFQFLASSDFENPRVTTWLFVDWSLYKLLCLSVNKIVNRSLLCTRTCLKKSQYQCYILNDLFQIFLLQFFVFSGGTSVWLPVCLLMKKSITNFCSICSTFIFIALFCC